MLVRFIRAWRMYQPGETAGFDVSIAEPLIAQGFAHRIEEAEEEAGAPAAAEAAANAEAEEAARLEAEAKAKAEADAKAAAEADAKAKAKS